MLWFIFNRSELRDEDGVECFFRRWGGEALYAVAQDPHIGVALSSVGVPCIVHAAVPANQLNVARAVPERFLTCFLRRRHVRTENLCGMEGFVRERVPADRILRVIRFGDRDFARLTNCNRWRGPLA